MRGDSRPLREDAHTGRENAREGGFSMKSSDILHVTLDLFDGAAGAAASGAG